MIPFDLDRTHAERLASFLGQLEPMFPNPQAAAELRRLQEVNQDLLEALKALLWLEEEALRGGDDIDICQEVEEARAAVAKATGE